MGSQWTPTSEALPSEGRNVEFVLDSREHAMTGTYRGCAFVSRWSEYAVGSVRQWRDASVEAAMHDSARARP